MYYINKYIAVNFVLQYILYCIVLISRARRRRRVVIEGEFYRLTDEEYAFIEDKCSVVVIEDIVYCIFDRKLKEHQEYLGQYGMNEMPTDEFLYFCFNNGVKVFPVPMNLPKDHTEEDADRAKEREMFKFHKLGLLADYNLARVMLEYCKYCLFSFKDSEEKDA